MKTNILIAAVITSILGLVAIVYTTAQKGRPVYKTPSEKSAIVAYIPKGTQTKIAIKDKGKEWTYIEFTITANSGPTVIRGYIQTKYLLLK